MKKFIFIFAILCFVSQLVIADEVRPEINGTIDNGCLLDGDENACAFMGDGSTRTGAEPPNIETGLVSTATDTNYITIDGLSITHSAGYGVRLGVNADHMVVTRNNISFSGKNGFGVRFNGTQTLVSGNSFYNNALCHYKNRGQDDHNAPNTCKKSFPAAVGLGGTTPHNAYVHFHDNDVSGSYGEAVGAYGVNYTWSHGNRIRGTRSGPQLIDNSSKHVIESSLFWDWDTTGLTSVIGTNGYSGAPDWNSTGVNVTIEPRSFCDGIDADGGTCETVDVLVRNNVMAAQTITGTAAKMNNKANIGVPPNPNVNDTEPLSVSWFHNLFVGEIEFDLGVDQDPQKGGLEFVNNIVQGTSTSDICGMFNSTGYTPYERDYTLFRVNPSDSDCDGTNDLTYGEVSTATDVDTFLEANCTEAACFDETDIVLTNGATGDDGGTRLNNESVAWLDNTEWDYFNDVTFPGGGTINGTNWEFKAYYDFTGQTRSVTPNVGPDETN